MLHRLLNKVEQNFQAKKVYLIYLHHLCTILFLEGEKILIIVDSYLVI